jgi:hypothetical protein
VRLIRGSKAILCNTYCVLRFVLKNILFAFSHIFRQCLRRFHYVRLFCLFDYLVRNNTILRGVGDFSTHIFTSINDEKL